MADGEDDVIVQEIIREAQKKIASEIARRNEKFENERAQIEERISKRNLEIAANRDMIQTYRSAIAEAEESNKRLKLENAADKQRKDEIITEIETGTKEREKQLLNSLRSKLSPASRLSTPGPEASGPEVNSRKPKPPLTLNASTRLRETQESDEPHEHDVDQLPTVRRSGRASKPVEHLLNTYFTEDKDLQLKTPTSPPKKEHSSHSRKRSLADDEVHQGGSANKKKVKAADQQEETIEYDEVFGDGEADIKYTIVEHPKGSSGWFILRCVEHDRHFVDDPLQAGAKHLGGKAHRFGPQDVDQAFQMFSVRVLNCNKSKAKKNNSLVQEAIDSGAYLPPGGYSPTVKSRQSRQKLSPLLSPKVEEQSDAEMSDAKPENGEQDKDGPGTSDPIVGRVYEIEWCRRPWTAVVLPTGDLSEVGMNGTLADTGFAPPWPSCYRRFNPRKGDPYMGIKYLYRDGKPRAHLKKIPIMYLEDNMVMPVDPSMEFQPPKHKPNSQYSSYDWVRPDELKAFEVNAPQSKKLGGFSTTRSFIKRLELLRGRKPTHFPAVSTTRGKIQETGVEDLIIMDDVNDSDYYEDSGSGGDNDENDEGDIGDDDDSDEDPRDMKTRARAGGRQSGSRSMSNSAKPTGKRKSTTAQESPAHDKSRFQPRSDVEESVSESASDDTLSTVRDISPPSPEGKTKDARDAKSGVDNSKSEVPNGSTSRNIQLADSAARADSKKPAQDVVQTTDKTKDSNTSVPKGGSSGATPKEAPVPAPSVAADPIKNGPRAPWEPLHPPSATDQALIQKAASGANKAGRPGDTQDAWSVMGQKQGSATTNPKSQPVPSPVEAPISPHPCSSQASTTQQTQPATKPPSQAARTSGSLKMENFLRPGLSDSSVGTGSGRSSPDKGGPGTQGPYTKTHDFGVPIGRRTPVNAGGLAKPPPPPPTQQSPLQQPPQQNTPPSANNGGIKGLIKVMTALVPGSGSGSGSGSGPVPLPPPGPPSRNVQATRPGPGQASVPPSPTTPRSSSFISKIVN